MDKAVFAAANEQVGAGFFELGVINLKGIDFLYQTAIDAETIGVCLTFRDKSLVIAECKCNTWLNNVSTDKFAKKNIVRYGLEFF